MPAVTVDITFSEPKPDAPKVPFASPVLRENTLPGNKKVMTIVFNKRIEDMTLADLQHYQQWIALVPDMMGPYMYHPDYISAVSEAANKIAEAVKTRLYMACPKSPDLHE
jgi:hypothetical protein